MHTRRLPLAGLLAAEAVAAVALHRLGDRPPFDLPVDRLDPWLRADPLDALAAGTRLAALAFVWWLAATTAAYAAARATRVPAAIRTLRLLTPAGVRLIVDRALVASLVVGALHVSVPAVPALRTPTAAVAAELPPPTVEVRTGRSATLPAPDAGGRATTTTTTTTTVPAGRTGPDAPRPATAPSTTIAAPAPPAPGSSPGAAEAPPPETGARAVVVQPGDNLWNLAADALASSTGRPRAAVRAAEVAPYWRAVCDANRASLRSGDVNLVYPGERIVLPPVS